MYIGLAGAAAATGIAVATFEWFVSTSKIITLAIYDRFTHSYLI